MEDRELAKLISEGDEKAFKKLYDNTQKKVLNICYRFTSNKDIAEEITQEVFIEVYRSAKRFKGRSKLSTWIYRIAVNKSLDYLRSQKSKKRFAYFVSIDKKGNYLGELTNKGGDPDKKLENKERKEILDKAMEKLPETQRVVLTLSKYKELSYKEIAEILGTTITSVDSLMSRGKKNLEKILIKYVKKIF